MKYILLAGSLLFGIAGISQAMVTLKTEGAVQLVAARQIFDFQFLTVSFTPAPGFVRVMVLSAGLFCMYLIWKKLKALGLDSISEYILE